MMSSSSSNNNTATGVPVRRGSARSNGGTSSSSSSSSAAAAAQQQQEQQRTPKLPPSVAAVLGTSMPSVPPTPQATSHGSVGDAQLARKEKHKLVEVKRRKRLAELFAALGEQLSATGLDKASLLQMAISEIRRKAGTLSIPGAKGLEKKQARRGKSAKWKPTPITLSHEVPRDATTPPYAIIDLKMDTYVVSIGLIEALGVSRSDAAANVLALVGSMAPDLERYLQNVRDNIGRAYEFLYSPKAPPSTAYFSAATGGGGSNLVDYKVSVTGIGAGSTPRLAMICFLPTAVNSRSSSSAASAMATLADERPSKRAKPSKAAGAAGQPSSSSSSSTQQPSPM